jgi:hypothetical protein
MEELSTLLLYKDLINNQIGELMSLYILTSIVIARFKKGIPKDCNEDECHLWQGHRDNDGYGDFCVSQDGHNKHYRAHIVSWMIKNQHERFYSDSENQILHTCIGHRSCINPKHLYKGNDQDNSNDAVDAGTKVKGEKHGMSKLSDEERENMRKEFHSGLHTYERMGKKYGVSTSQAYKIINKEHSNTPKVKYRKRKS